MVTGETLRHVLWIAQDFAAFTSVRVWKPHSNFMFDLWPSRGSKGKTKVTCYCSYCGMLKGPSCMLRSIPESGTPVALQRRGIDLDETGWHIDESDLFSALDCVKTAIRFRTGKKLEDL